MTERAIRGGSKACGICQYDREIVKKLLKENVGITEKLAAAERVKNTFSRPISKRRQVVDGEKRKFKKGRAKVKKNAAHDLRDIVVEDRKRKRIEE